MNEHPRGDLRILLGAAPGVGKTFAMLNEGRRLAAEGVDVVIGLVETHGRAETEAQIGDLEVVPRQAIPRGSVTIHEMDAAAIIARDPDVVLIDELAHSNAPGARRKRRWEDIGDIRDAGIDVITTLNIQHIAELGDVVEGLTGIDVRETVPDAVLASATDVQLIDIPAEVILRRLEQGKIYPAHVADRALTGFFRQGNLTALRELALRRTASGVDVQLARLMLGETPDDHPSVRIAIVITDHPQWDDVLRAAWRLASALHGDLFAFSTGQEATDAMRRHRQLAIDLGADVVDTTTSIASTFDAYRITDVVVGTSRRHRWGRTTWPELDAMLELPERIDIHVVRIENG